MGLLQAKPEKTAVVSVRVPLSLKQRLDELRTEADKAGFDLSATLTEAIERATRQIASELEASKPKAASQHEPERADKATASYANGAVIRR